MARDPVLRELFEKAYRQIDEASAQAAKRHQVVVRDLEWARAHRERVQAQYADLERTVTTASERFVRSEKIFVEAMSELANDMRESRERLDRIGDDSAVHRETLFAILDRLEDLRR